MAHESTPTQEGQLGTYKTSDPKPETSFKQAPSGAAPSEHRVGLS